jgi:hypothetical protein
MSVSFGKSDLASGSVLRISRWIENRRSVFIGEKQTVFAVCSIVRSTGGTLHVMGQLPACVFVLGILRLLRITRCGLVGGLGISGALTLPFSAKQKACFLPDITCSVEAMSFFLSNAN